MQYPIRKTLLAGLLSVATLSFANTEFKDVSHATMPVGRAVPAKTMVMPTPAPMPSASGNESEALFTDLNLEAAGMQPQVFETALKGFNKLWETGQLANTHIIT